MGCRSYPALQNVMKLHEEMEKNMLNVVKINKKTEEDELISYSEAAKLLGMKYNAAYNLLKYTNKITKFVYGRRNVKISKNSVLAFRDSYKIVGEY